ncbi:hypothetical protein EDB83DRAFT_2408168 [Lactarius deliciosus]|nr:hypothetical protein EDB83DRAFT_2408168 [Lactarius deliciosus]
MNYPHTFSASTDTTPSPADIPTNVRRGRFQCGPYLGDRVIRLQRLLDLNSTSNMLKKRTNLEDLTETNATTIAPAPAPPHSLTTAHIGKKFSLTYCVTRLGHLPLAHPTLVFDLPLPRRLVLTVPIVDKRHFLSIAAERWQRGSGISLIFTCLYTGSPLGICGMYASVLAWKMLKYHRDRPRHMGASQQQWV